MDLQDHHGPSFIRGKDVVPPSPDHNHPSGPFSKSPYSNRSEVPLVTAEGEPGGSSCGISYEYSGYAPYPMDYQHQVQVQHQMQYPLSPVEQQMNTSPPSPSTSSSSNAGQQRRRSSVGMRRVSPDALIDLDAPTQPRRYVTPSTTSRKEVPAFFGQRAMYSKMQPASDGEDELTEEPPAADATDQEKIEWKRRQNTLAARRSRKRKLQQQQALEDAVEQLSRDKEMWKTRALTLRQLLLSHGIPCPDFKD
ncbi:hypothetical protein BKA70DRAFT_173739 [Coprinopsis sp. MPI-PUGE-AT-0042]|nr:hypothetical protein BKA70DRAFT_173739 [Coprinopsis sp. MPI-PUGE-AT-0042]